MNEITEETPGMSIDKSGFQELRLACDAAKLAGRESFMFRDHEFLVSYAEYLIEFLGRKFV